MKDNNLNTLRILFIIKGVLTLITSFFIIIMFLGLGTFVLEDAAQQEEIPFNVKALLSSLGAVAFLISLALSIMTFLSAKYIRERRKHTFIVVTSILNCLGGILGMMLGIFALIELHQKHVKPLFAGKSSEEVL